MSASTDNKTGNYTRSNWRSFAPTCPLPWPCRGTVVHKAKLCILDYIANIYGSLKMEAVQQVVCLCPVH